MYELKVTGASVYKKLAGKKFDKSFLMRQTIHVSKAQPRTVGLVNENRHGQFFKVKTF